MWGQRQTKGSGMNLVAEYPVPQKVNGLPSNFGGILYTQKGSKKLPTQLLGPRSSLDEEILAMPFFTRQLHSTPTLHRNPVWLSV